MKRTETPLEAGHTTCYPTMLVVWTNLFRNTLDDYFVGEREVKLCFSQKGRKTMLRFSDIFIQITKQQNLSPATRSLE